MFGIGQDQFALRSVAVTWPTPPIEIAFPVDVRALIVRGDEDVRRAIRRVIVEPLDIVPARARLTSLVARRAVRYDDASVFFLDDRSFAEPEGFWVGGSRQSAFVVQPDAPRPSVDLHLRNAPIENRLTIASGQWQEVLTLAPGEERRVQVPLAPGQAAVAGDGDDDRRLPPVGIDTRQPGREVPGGVGLKRGLGADRPGCPVLRVPGATGRRARRFGTAGRGQGCPVLRVPRGLWAGPPVLKVPRGHAPCFVGPLAP